MTSVRFEQIRAGAAPVDDSEQREYDQIAVWKARSDAGKRGVMTKRRRYTKWPTKRGDHKRRRGQ